MININDCRGVVPSVFKVAILAAGLCLVAPIAALAQGAPQPAPSNGAWLSSIKIEVADVQKAKDFYVGQLGMKVGPQYGRSEFGLEWPGGGAVLVLVQGSKIPRGGSAMIVIVPDVMDLSARLVAAGYKDVGKPIVNPAMTIVFTKDPDGNVVELITLAAPT